MSNENELLEPLATEAGQLAIARAINNFSSLEYAVRAEHAATTAIQKADEASNSADDASDYATEARNWATKTDGYVVQETITTPPEQEGDEPTTETIDLYSARYYAALAQDIYNNLQFDTEPTENSTALVSSGAIYTALSGKADKSDTYTKTEVDTALSGKADQSTTYTKTEVDTALSNVQSTLTFDNVPTANSDNPVKSSGIKTALDGKQDTLTFDSTPTANSNNPVTSGGIYTALQNVEIEIDDEITEDSDNPVTSAAIYEALQNFTPSGGGGGDTTDVYGFASINTNDVIDTLFNWWSDWTKNSISSYTATKNCYICGVLSQGGSSNTPTGSLGVIIKINNVQVDIVYSTTSGSTCVPITYPLRKGDTISFTFSSGIYVKGRIDAYGVVQDKILSEQMYSNVLYENSSGVTSGTITFNDDLSNYDFAIFHLLPTGWQGGTFSYIMDTKNITGISIGVNTETYMFFTTNGTTATISEQKNIKLVKVIGYKLAKGGYSGIVSDARMTVKSGRVTTPSNITNGNVWETDVTFDSPMPDTNYYILAQTSNDMGGVQYIKTRVRDNEKTINGFRFVVMASGGTVNAGHIVDWIAIRPNSYTREGMVEDVLFSDASGVNSGTINLSGNISDYDLIQFSLKQEGSESYSRNQNTYTSSQLIDYLNNNQYFVLVSIATEYNKQQKYIKLHCGSDRSFVVDALDDNSVHILITKITGIKFGRYVSGVAVDTTVTQNSNAVVTSGAVYDALQNVSIYTAGDGIDLTNDEISLETASANNIGGVKVGTGLSIDANGVLSATGVSTVIDAVPTENSSNVVSSGGVYDALDDISIEESTIKYVTNGTLTADSTYLRNTASEVICSSQAYGKTYNFTKTNAIPAIACRVKTKEHNQNSYDWMWICLVSNEYDALAITSNRAMSVKQEGTVFDTNTRTLLYYKVYDADCHPGGNLYYLNSSSYYSNPLLVAQDLLEVAQPTIVGGQTISIKDKIFNPTNYNISSGSIIPSSENWLRGAIAAYHFIKINGEIYYFIKTDNNSTYYYESANNSMTITSQFLVTITPKTTITVDSSITQNGTNPVQGGAIYTALAGKQDTLTIDTTPTADSTNPVTSGGVYTALQNLPTGSGDVTTNTDQNITGTKTFVGSKKVAFKQSATNDKLGFTLFSNSNAERGYLEFNPTNTVDGVAGLMTLGNYATSAASLTQVGFRRYSNISGQSGAYNLLMPMIADARTPFSLTTSYQNFYLPLGFTDGTTTVRTAKSGLVDLSPLLASLEARIAALEGN